MYAIVEIAGKQFKAEKNKNLKVPLLQKQAGDKIQFDRILFMNTEKGENLIGNPVLDGMLVSATVVEHGRDKKIIVFKKKRRKGYQVKNGHRQNFSLIKIDEIGDIKTVKAVTIKKEVKEEKTDNIKVKPAAEKIEKKVPVKKAVKTEKPAAKKPDAQKPAAAGKKKPAPEKPAKKKEK
jgi:large subunit ribosomal protein L21